MRLLRAITAVAALVALSACEETLVKDINAMNDQDAPTARIRYFNFSITPTSTTTTNASHLFSGSTPITATLSTTGAVSTGGINFGGVSAGGFYSAITPGQHELNSRLVTVADQPVIASVSANLESGKYYSFYLSGAYNSTTRTADAFVVEDPIPAEFDWTAAYVRFVNASANSQPMTMYLDNANTPTVEAMAVGGAVAYKNAGEFVKVPPAVYNLVTRYTGDATDRFVRTSVTFLPGYVYTITARGDVTVSSTGTAWNRAFLDNTVNR